nr:hypothetical protein Iba_chr04aCG2410 [Ipomoea batatas]
MIFGVLASDAFAKASRAASDRKLRDNSETKANGRLRPATDAAINADESCCGSTMGCEWCDDGRACRRPEGCVAARESGEIREKQKTLRKFDLGFRRIMVALAHWLPFLEAARVVDCSAVAWPSTNE